MVGKTTKQIILTCMAVLLALSPLLAAENPVITLDLLPTMTYKANDDTWSDDSTVADLTLTLASKREGNVRGEVVLKGNPSTAIILLLKFITNISHPQ